MSMAAKTSQKILKKVTESVRTNLMPNYKRKKSFLHWTSSGFNDNDVNTLVDEQYVLDTLEFSIRL